MSIRGQRVQLNLDGDGPLIDGAAEPSTLSKGPRNFVEDVQERPVTNATAPQPPAQGPSKNGFPARRSRWAAARSKPVGKPEGTLDKDVDIDQKQPVDVPAVPRGGPESEQQQIDRENRNRLASMSDTEILEERQGLLDTVNPALLQALLRRSKLVDGGEQTDFPGLETTKGTSTAKSLRSTKKVTFEQSALEAQPSSMPPGHAGMQQMDKPSEERKDPSSTMDNVQVQPDVVPQSSIHFPRPDQPPELDPSSPSFLEDLHKKYFPSLPADPEKLQWMMPSQDKNPYEPGQAALDPKDIRFAFDGALIPPSAAAAIPVSVGLHHHADAPDAAGYTIPELAILARSSVASQRCIAFQTLGRVLYRLGKGEFGNPSEGSAGAVGAQDTRAELARGLWSEVEKERIVDICTAESEGRSMAGGRHVSAQAYATEAIWLWQKGGGRRWRTD